MTAPLDEKGLEAARKSVGTIPGAWLWGATEVAIRAYLATLPSSSMEVVAWKMPDGKTTLGKAGWAFITRQKNHEDYEPGQYEALQADIANAEPLVTEAAAQAIIKGLEAERDALRSDNVDLLAAADADAFAMSTLAARVTAAEAERDALQRKLDMHEAALSFVHRWAVQKEGNGTSAEERLSAIAHHPAIAARKAMEGGGDLNAPS